MARRLLDLLGAGLLGIATLWLWLAPDRLNWIFVSSDRGDRCSPRFGMERFKRCFSGSDSSAFRSTTAWLYWQPAPMETLLPQPWFRLPSILEDSLKKEPPSASILPLRRFDLGCAWALRVAPESARNGSTSLSVVGQTVYVRAENGFL